MRSLFEKYKFVFSLTFITSVLYFCGYLSSEYYNRVLGIRVNYDALDIIRWGADFFLYSVIDFFASFTTFGNDWLRLSFILLIFGDIIILIIARCLTKDDRAFTGLFKGLKEKFKLSYWSVLFCVLTVAFSIVYLTRFIGKTDLEYKELLRLGNLNVIYSYFIILNCLNIWNLLNTDWKSVRRKNLKYILLIPLFFLPALYGVYGRNYNFNCVQKTLNNTAILLESHKGKNYILERKYNCEQSVIVDNKCDDVHYQYLILNDEDISLSVEKLNFFGFIKDRYNENNE